MASEMVNVPAEELKGWADKIAEASRLLLFAALGDADEEPIEELREVAGDDRSVAASTLRLIAYDMCFYAGVES